MEAWLWVLVAVVVLALGAVAFALVRTLQQRRSSSRSLRERFGDEYDLVVARFGRRAGEADLRDRLVAFHDSPPQRLTPDERAESTRDLLEIQFWFLDRPVGSVRDAEHVVEHIMEQRGMPVSDVEARAAVLSVAAPELVAGYRRAYDALRRADAGEPSISELFYALRTYRDVAELLLERPKRETAIGEMEMPAWVGSDDADRGEAHHAVAR